MIPESAGATTDMPRPSGGATEATVEDGHGFPRLPRDLIVSALSGVAAFLIAGVAEWTAIRLTQVDPRKLDGLSDLVLAVAFATAVFLRARLKASRAEVSRLEKTQLVLDTQLGVAADIQRRVLPSPPRPTAGLCWAARLRPAGRIGGDFYDFVETDRDSILAVLADISGKGIPAAMLLTSTRVLLRSIAREVQDPGEVLTRLSAATYAEYEGLPYVTCLALSLDASRRRLVYANAGHPAGVIVGKRRRCLLEAGGPPLGLFAGSPYTSASLSLAAGDVGLLVTDGVTEALDAVGYTPAEALAAVLSRLGGAATPDGVCDEIMGMVERGPAGSPPDGRDDRTIVVFTLEGDGP